MFLLDIFGLGMVILVFLFSTAVIQLKSDPLRSITIIVVLSFINYFALPNVKITANLKENPWFVVICIVFGFLLWDLYCLFAYTLPQANFTVH